MTDGRRTARMNGSARWGERYASTHLQACHLVLFPSQAQVSHNTQGIGETTRTGAGVRLGCLAVVHGRGNALFQACGNGQIHIYLLP